MKMQVDGCTLDVQFSQGKVCIDGKIYTYEQAAHGILWNKKLYHVDILDHHVVINSRPFSVQRTAEHDERMQGAVQSPLTGMVSKIMANVGDSVKKGDTLLIIEAMKMENHICAPKEGKVKAILVTQGQAAKEGQALVEME